MWPRMYVPFQELRQPSRGVPAQPAVQASGQFGPLNGTYRSTATFLGIAGETAPSVSASVTIVNGTVQVTLPTGPDPYVSGRRLYRTAASGADGTQQLVATVAANTTTVYVDSTPDGSLGAAQPAADSTLNQPIFELGVPDSRLPSASNPQNIGITFGAKHIIAANDTTVPEQRHDVVLLGAAAYACLAYQVQTNDLFQYQDGELRDRVDETKPPEHWLAAGTNLLNEYKARLEEVKRQRDAGYASVAQWGAVPSRWQWT